MFTHPCHFAVGDALIFCVLVVERFILFDLSIYMHGCYGYIYISGDTQVFSASFSGINTANFDPNYPASLTIECPRSGGIYMYSGAFANMSHIQHFKVTFSPLVIIRILYRYSLH